MKINKYLNKIATSLMRLDLEKKEIIFFFLLFHLFPEIFFVKIEPIVVQVEKLLSKCATQQFPRSENSDTNP